MLLAAVVAMLATAWAGAGAGFTADAGTSCVAHRGEARSNGYGYRHVVVLTSSCAKVADCDVSSDVNPTVQKVVIDPKAVVEVVTFFDSPASTFVPKVACTPRK